MKFLSTPNKGLRPLRRRPRERPLGGHLHDLIDVESDGEFYA